MRSQVLSGLHACGWLALGTLVAFVTRTVVYAFAPSSTSFTSHLAGATGRPSLTLELVACALAAMGSFAIVGTAAVAIAERRRLEPLALSSSSAIEPVHVARRAVAIFVASSVVFAVVESYVHWRSGLGFHGLRCLTGPVHRDALPFLAALSLVAAAALSAGAHVLAWLRRTIARLIRRVERVLRPLRRRLLMPLRVAFPTCGRAASIGARAPPRRLLVRLAEKNPANKEGERMRVTRSRSAVVLAVTVMGALVAANAAFAHAEISPPVAKAKTGQLFTLAVPTEEENATTTTVELTPPAGFSIDSFAPTPGWKRDVRQTGEGEDAVIQKVTWSGGKVPTDEDAVFQFIASTDSAKTYSFDVRQTYSDGKVVDWSGPESSDTPAPAVEAKSSIGGGSSILSIVALVVGAVGLLIGLAALFSGRRTLA
jgi:uncharacterized protein YcnI